MTLARRRILQLLSGAIATAPFGSAKAQRADPSIPIVPRLSITPEAAARVGRQVWINESGGSPDGVTAWNAGEDFPSLGIGHWIWFKAGGHPIFEESFPKLIEFMRVIGAKPPAWLDRQPFPPCPWLSKAEFERQFRSPHLVELRRFLNATVPQQTQYLLARTQAAIPRMLATLPSPNERQHLLSQLDRVARSSPDLYPLIDYTNFKGEGVSDKETRFDPASGRNQGWGLKYLLIEMNGAATGEAALAEFSRAAKAVLDRRIANHPASARWRAGWHKRCDTYRRPLA